MPFPEVQRVDYQRNPLKSAVCQLRFPAILRIDSELPVALQEQVRGQFPDFKESAEFNIAIPSSLGEQVAPELIRQALQSTAIKNYAFATLDNTWRINLTRTFMALSTTAYTRWEDFRERLSHPLQALVEVYQPAYFSRIGLRYVDKIERSILGLQGVPWRELLSPDLIGMLGSAEVAEHVDTLELVQGIHLANDGGSARIASSLSESDGRGEQVFTLDGDFFFTNRTDVDAVLERLDFLHARATGLIRWAVTDRLHEAMEPQPL